MNSRNLFLKIYKKVDDRPTDKQTDQHTGPTYICDQPSHKKDGPKEVLANFQCK